MKTPAQNPDVIIVGAGTAGLSAAAALQEAGLQTIVLEAANHVGGRCVTDTSCFETPFDRGGSWLHSAEINPLSKLAEEHGFALHKKRWLWEKVIANGRNLTPDEVTAYREYMEQMWQPIEDAGTKGSTESIDAVLPPSPFKDTAKLFIAQLLGGDFDVTSPADIARYDDTDEDWLIAGGLGNFVKHLHTEVDVVLNTPVSTIDTSGTTIRVTTPSGTIEAKYVIVTVSVGVLAAEKIEFIPPLPDSKLKAINGLPNGLLNKVGIEFDPKWQEAGEGFMLDYHTGGEEYCSILFGFYGGNLTTGFTAGRFAKLLEIEGEGAATDFCMQGLRAVFGGDITKHIRKTSETAWQNNPYTLGSYSYLSPNCIGAREALAAPLEERLFFAGEATMPDAFATVHGAYISGKQAAAQIMNAH